MKNWLAMLGISAIAGLGAVHASAADIAVPQKLQDQGKIIFCSDLKSPPSQYIAEDGQTPTGVAYDMLLGIGDELGLPVEMFNVAFSGIFPALDSGNCNGIMASTSKSPERLEKYNFVDYWSVQSGLLVPKGNPDNLSTFEDLAGKRVAVLLGSANERRLKAANETLAAAGKPEMEIATYPGNTTAFQELDLGRVDAMVSDTLVLSYFMSRSDGRFEIGGTPVPPATLGIIVAKQDVDIANAFRAALDDMAANGKLQAIIDKWGVGAGLSVCTTDNPCQ
ncbi:ABC transporter substrate-binding protein [Martelella sp. HB161492]|uniref:ABC transporter substrate-binding protein n=1 Tax=Martelella sp. HB161492 TaxID=2720726 RepID=UPI001592348B|nr:ABC transporter substrate-binding protein [Martelella sp. HB161492]